MLSLALLSSSSAPAHAGVPAATAHAAASNAPACPSPGVLSGGTCTATFTSAGPSEETFPIPAGVVLTVTADGAPGGQGDYNGTPQGSPGGGGMEQGTFNVTSPDTLAILVGDAGDQASAGGEGGGGFGDSAFFGSQLHEGGKGGGGSYVFGAGGAPLVVAGGGGGTGSDNFNVTQVGGAGGGAAGGTAGQAGFKTNATPPGNAPGQGGGGATPGAAGAGGAAGGVDSGFSTPLPGQAGKGPVSGPSDPDITDGNAGLDAIGGFGGGGGNPGTNSDFGMAGGGGGGYTGGGGGGDSNLGGGGAGGGGSGYVAPGALKSSGAAGVWFGNVGQVTISYLVGATISGTLTSTVQDPAGTPVANFPVAIDGTDSQGQAVHTVQTTDTQGGYAAVLQPGSYTVSPQGSPPGEAPGSHWSVSVCDGTAGIGSCSITLAQGDLKHASFSTAPHQVTVTLDQSSVTTSGFGLVSATITDKDSDGNPVVGQTIKIEPPLTYDNPALVCDESNRFVYPTRLSDGFILGSSFTRITDGSGQIHLTVFVGTVAGDWLLDAGEPNQPLSQWGHADLGIDESGSRTDLSPELPALLVAASDNTLANFRQSPLLNALQWLGATKTGANAGVLAGVGFMPIWARDPGGFVNDGLVLFADAPACARRSSTTSAGRRTLRHPRVRRS